MYNTIVLVFPPVVTASLIAATKLVLSKVVKLARLPMFAVLVLTLEDKTNTEEFVVDNEALTLPADMETTDTVEFVELNDVESPATDVLTFKSVDRFEDSDDDKFAVEVLTPSRVDAVADRLVLIFAEAVPPAFAVANVSLIAATKFVLAVVFNEAKVPTLELVEDSDVETFVARVFVVLSNG